jgi:hypothetical protein
LKRPSMPRGAGEAIGGLVRGIFDALGLVEGSGSDVSARPCEEDGCGRLLEDAMRADCLLGSCFAVLARRGMADRVVRL